MMAVVSVATAYCYCIILKVQYNLYTFTSKHFSVKIKYTTEILIVNFWQEKNF